MDQMEGAIYCKESELFKEMFPQDQQYQVFYDKSTRSIVFRIKTILFQVALESTNISKMEIPQEGPIYDLIIHKKERYVAYSIAHNILAVTYLRGKGGKETQMRTSKEGKMDPILHFQWIYGTEKNIDFVLCKQSGVTLYRLDRDKHILKEQKVFSFDISACWFDPINEILCCSSVHEEGKIHPFFFNEKRNAFKYKGNEFYVDASRAGKQEVQQKESQSSSAAVFGFITKQINKLNQKQSVKFITSGDQQNQELTLMAQDPAVSHKIQLVVLYNKTFLVHLNPFHNRVALYFLDFEKTTPFEISITSPAESGVRFSVCDNLLLLHSTSELLTLVYDIRNKTSAYQIGPPQSLQVRTHIIQHEGTPSSIGLQSLKSRNEEDDDNDIIEEDKGDNLKQQQNKSILPQGISDLIYAAANKVNNSSNTNNNNQNQINNNQKQQNTQKIEVDLLSDDYPMQVTQQQQQLNPGRHSLLEEEEDQNPICLLDDDQETVDATQANNILDPLISKDKWNFLQVDSAGPISDFLSGGNQNSATQQINQCGQQNGQNNSTQPIDLLDDDNPPSNNNNAQAAINQIPDQFIASGIQSKNSSNQLFSDTVVNLLLEENEEEIKETPKIQGELYDLGKNYFAGDEYIFNARDRKIYQTKVDIHRIERLATDEIEGFNVIMRRANSKEYGLQHLRFLFQNHKEVRFFGLLFSQILNTYKRKLQFNQMNSDIISPRDIQDNFFFILSEKIPATQRPYLLDIFIEYMKTTAELEIETSSDLQLLLAKLLISGRKMNTFLFFVQYRVITDSEELAISLLSMRQFKQGFQLGLDMLLRLKRYYDIVNILLNRGHYQQALDLMRKHSLNKIGLKQMISLFIRQQGDMSIDSIHEYFREILNKSRGQEKFGFSYVDFVDELNNQQASFSSQTNSFDLF